MTVATLGIAVESSPAARAATDLDKLAASAMKAEASAAKVATAAKLTSNQMFNLSRQANDVATMFALGAPPMQIFASQAGQIVDALQQGPGGLTGSLKAVGDGILGLVTRFPLATAAIVAAGAAWAAYELVARNDIKSVDEVLEDHKKLIESLADSYPKVAEAAQQYEEIASRLPKSVIEADAATKAASDLDTLKEKFSEVGREIRLAITDPLSGQQGDVGGFGEKTFATFQRLLVLLDSGKITAKDLATQLADIQLDPNATSEGKQFATTLSSAAAEALKVENALGGTTRAVEGMKSALSDADQATADFKAKLLEAAAAPEPLRKALQDVFDAAQDGTQPLAAVMAKLNELENANPTFAGIIEGFRKLIEQANAAAASVANINLGGTRTKDDNAFPPTITLPGSAPTPDERPNAEDIGAANDKRLARANRGANRAATAYRDVLKAAQDRIDQMKVELELTGQVGVAADTLRNYQELLGRATDHGRAIGEKQKAELHDRAEAMAKLEEATKAAKLQQDLLFDRQQMFRSPTEQDVYGTLRDADVDINSAAGAALAAQIRLNDNLKETRDLAGDFVNTFVDGLKNGENAFQAFGDAALSVLDKIADKLLNSAIDSLFSSFLGGTGLGGGTPDPFQDVFASSKGNAFDRGNVIPFAKGGVVNRMSTFQMAGGRTGSIAETAPEGILPLKRNSSGQLGVMATGGGQMQSANQNGRIVVELSQDLVAKILEQSGNQSIEIVKSNNEAQANRYQNGASR
ncbi:hypothetical protein FJ951_27130 [Mesorhizobium sp. B2-2-3]|uniref:phage tail length tape measure family protein n=1 Tax=Mesorhizobium sp. B2-2-3 TaxID=2589963 RepID=UPI0011261CEC|nr:phage tail length tape measure family protein [Mesorhizobium sp. B2-2-3]TPM39383.1 hypothetical protein FJ951_27130 [Mesorhizobium sp. B2-2-3]